MSVFSSLLQAPCEIKLHLLQDVAFLTPASSGAQADESLPVSAQDQVVRGMVEIHCPTPRRIAGIKVKLRGVQSIAIVPDVRDASNPLVGYAPIAWEDSVLTEKVVEIGMGKGGERHDASSSALNVSEDGHRSRSVNSRSNSRHFSPSPNAAGGASSPAMAPAASGTESPTERGRAAGHAHHPHNSEHHGALAGLGAAFARAVSRGRPLSRPGSTATSRNPSRAASPSRARSPARTPGTATPIASQSGADGQEEAAPDYFEVVRSSPATGSPAAAQTPVAVPSSPMISPSDTTDLSPGLSGLHLNGQSDRAPTPERSSSGLVPATQNGASSRPGSSSGSAGPSTPLVNGHAALPGSTTDANGRSSSPAPGAHNAAVGKHHRGGLGSAIRSSSAGLFGRSVSRGAISRSAHHTPSRDEEGARSGVSATGGSVRAPSVDVLRGIGRGGAGRRNASSTRNGRGVSAAAIRESRGEGSAAGAEGDISEEEWVDHAHDGRRDSHAGGLELAKGVHGFEFAFIIKADMPPYERSPYGRVRYILKATAYGAGRAKSNVEAWREVFPIVNPSADGGPMPLTVLFNDVHPTVGLLSVACTSTNVSVGGIFNIDIYSPTPPRDLIVYLVRVSLETSIELRTKRKGKQQIPPAKVKLFQKGWVPPRPKDPHGQGDGKKSEGVIRDPNRPGATPDDAWSVQGIARMPNDNVTRPTTASGSKAAIRFSHTLVVEVVHSRDADKPDGERKLKVFALRQPIVLPSCCVAFNSVALPVYTAEDSTGRDATMPYNEITGTVTHGEMHDACMCGLSMQDLGERERSMIPVAPDYDVPINALRPHGKIGELPESGLSLARSLSRSSTGARSRRSNSVASTSSRRPASISRGISRSISQARAGAPLGRTPSATRIVDQVGDVGDGAIRTGSGAANRTRSVDPSGVVSNSISAEGLAARQAADNVSLPPSYHSIDTEEDEDEDEDAASRFRHRRGSTVSTSTASVTTFDVSEAHTGEGEHHNEVSNARFGAQSAVAATERPSEESGEDRRGRTTARLADVVAIQ